MTTSPASPRMRSRHTALPRLALTILAVGALAACGSGGGFSNASPSGGAAPSAAVASSGAAPSGAASSAPKVPSGVKLSVLIGSSGQTETDAVTKAAQAWASSTGNTVTVTPASNIEQQLAQGFAAGSPPDLFYVDAAKFADYAAVNALYPYVAQIPDASDIYPALQSSFTYKGTPVCLPKDSSTLALEINDEKWKAAGLTDADIPKTWDQLKAVATKLTTGGTTGLAIGDTRDRVGAFLLQSGGWWLNADGTQATADSPANVAALDYVKSLLGANVAKFPKQLDSGWAGEAFGKGKAAMTMEGNWIKGALKSDYPNVKYTIAPLPAGPAGMGTLSFTQCWGIAAKSGQQAAAVDLVKALTTKEQQLSNAAAFGVMPSRQSAEADYKAQFPKDEAFLAGVKDAHGPVKAPKFTQVLSDLDTGIQQLKSTDPNTLLKRVQKNMSAALAG